MKKHAALQQAVKFFVGTSNFLCSSSGHLMTNDSWGLWKDLDLTRPALTSQSPSRRYDHPCLTYPLNTAPAPCDPSGGKVRAM